MFFKNAVFTTREIEIGRYLTDKHSLKEIGQITGLSKKILKAHIRNMMKKLKTNDPDELKKMIQSMDH